ncbi:hypothetical protein [Bacillus pseudomycoides]|uniref:hypothetical protein n=1 Tax=Bacillus pseudomycoides TaxID=64104 RepID=UPI0015CF0DF4|nr:hypothetical protein [Bacillus pseudomycoides]
MEFTDEQWVKYIEWCTEKEIERVSVFTGYSDFLTENYTAPPWKPTKRGRPKKTK